MVRIRELSRMKRNGKLSKAIIVDFKIDKDPEGTVSYLQIVEYEIEGKIFRTLIDDPLNQKPAIGKTINIYYNESNSNFVVTDMHDALTKNYMGLFLFV